MGLEGLAFQIEQILFADWRAGCDISPQSTSAIFVPNFFS